MKFVIKERLEKQEYERILDFLSSLDYYCIEQHPDWNSEVEIFHREFLIGVDDNGLVNCFGNIILSNSQFKTANIKFGPAFKDFKVLMQSIEYLHGYFNSNKFIYFSIQLGAYINNQTELLEYKINREFKVKYYFKPGNLWASTCVNLTRSEDEILKSFVRGHRSRLKKVYSNGDLRSFNDQNYNSLQLFIELYIKMMTGRKLPFNKDETTHFIKRLHDFLYNKGLGCFEYVYQGDVLVGGAVIIFQGNTARYFKGASDHQRRDIPILHFGLFEAMKYCKKKGMVNFDLWGYNHFVDRTDQIFFINEFKSGFGGDFTFFPKRMNFILRPASFNVYNLLKNLKRKIVR